MKARWLAAAVLAAITAAGGARAQTTLLHDNFDNETAGVFPRHWKLIYNGAGTGQQVLDTAHARSVPNALKLVGVNCNEAEVFHPFTLPTPTAGVDQHVVLSTWVYVGTLGSGGCNPWVSIVSLCDPKAAPNWHWYAAIFLLDNRKITVGPGWEGGAPQTPVTRRYNAGHWSKLTVDADLTTRTASFSMNGALLASDVAFDPARPGTPTGVCFVTGDSNGATAWFDNVLVQVP